MKRIFTSIAMMLLMMVAFAQVPQKMSYQAVVRNSAGTLVSETELPVIVSILQGSEDGESVYTETHQVKTNKNGLISLEIGAGFAEGNNDFSTIDWANGPYFIMTQVIVEGMPITITSELLSVPYAQYAETAGSVPGMDSFANKNEVAETYATKAEVEGTYATKYDLEEHYVNKDDYQEVDLNGYVTQDDLTGYAKSDDLDNYLKKEDYNEVSIEGLLSKEEADATYATPSDIPSVDGLLSKEEADAAYASKTAIPTTVAELEDADSYLQDSDLSDWAKAEEKPVYDYSEIANTPAIPSVEGLLSKEEADATYVKPSDIPSVEGLLTKEEADATYATSSDIPNVEGLLSKEEAASTYAKPSDIPTTVAELSDANNYALKSDLSNVQADWSEADAEAAPFIKNKPVIPTTVAELEDADSYLQDSDLSDWAKAEEKPAYDYSEIANTPAIPSVEGLLSKEEADATYAKPSDIPSTVAELSDANNYALKSDVPTTVAELEDGDSYLQDSDLSDWAKAEEKPVYDYSEIANTPAIPSVEGLLSKEEADATYAKPSDIPTTVAELSDANNYALKSEVPTTVAELEDADSYLQDADLSDWAKAEEKPVYDYSEIANTPAIPSKTSDLTNDAGFLTEHQDISGKANVADLSTVATSGSYNDLTNKPTIPTTVAELEDADSYLQDSDLSDWAKAEEKPVYDYSEIANTPAIPSKTSDLTNDAGFLTAHQDISGKANTADLSDVATSGSYNDLIDQPTIPTKTSELTNDAGFLTAHQDISGKANTADLSDVATSGDYNDLENKPTIPTKTSELTNDAGFLTAHQDISGKANTADLSDVATSGDYNDLTNKPTIPTTVAQLDDYESYAQFSDLSDVATTGDYNDLENKPTIPTKTSELTNDAGFLTAHQDISGKANTADLSDVAISGDYNDLTNKPTIPTKTSELTNDAGFLTAHQDISGKANTADLSDVATSGDYNDLTNKPTIPTTVAQLDDYESYAQFSDLSDVATSGDYNDLENKPTIPTKTSELTNDAGFLTAHQDISGKANTADLSDVATSGDYNDLEHTPDLSVYALKTDLTSLGNVQPDWTQDDAEAADFIKNKPTIPTTVAELEDYDSYVQFSDLSQADWEQDDEDADDFIKNKPALSTVATSGDYADLSNTPTNVSEFTNDAEYITKTELEALKERIKLGVRADLATGTTYKGAFMSAFSVSETKRVVFSQGNLQYQPSTGTWRFAEHQYDAVGGLDKDGVYGGNVYVGAVKCGNENANNASYTGWIDVFPYGTSGWESGATSYKPTDYTKNKTDYLVQDLQGDYANADWGVYNAISNGGNKTGMWRTMTSEEWNYVIRERANASELFSLGSISIVDAEDGDDDDIIPGFILLPDDWVCPDGLSFTPSNIAASGTDNVYNLDAGYMANNYTESEWAQMQAAGAVFFPSSGACNVKSDGTFQLKNIKAPRYTSYWTSTNWKWVTVNDKTEAGTSWQLQLQTYTKVYGACVRLVRDIE